MKLHLVHLEGGWDNMAKVTNKITDMIQQIARQENIGNSLKSVRFKGNPIESNANPFRDLMFQWNLQGHIDSGSYLFSDNKKTFRNKTKPIRPLKLKTIQAKRESASPLNQLLFRAASAEQQAILSQRELDQRRQHSSIRDDLEAALIDSQKSQTAPKVSPTTMGNIFKYFR